MRNRLFQLSLREITRVKFLLSLSLSLSSSLCHSLSYKHTHKHTYTHTSLSLSISFTLSLSLLQTHTHAAFLLFYFSLPTSLPTIFLFQASLISMPEIHFNLNKVYTLFYPNIRKKWSKFFQMFKTVKL